MVSSAGRPHRAFELGPRQRWGWLLRKEQKQQAEGLCLLETWWAVSGGSQQPCPSTLWHPRCLHCEGGKTRPLRGHSCGLNLLGLAKKLHLRWEGAVEDKCPPSPIP